MMSNYTTFSKEKFKRIRADNIYTINISTGKGEKISAF